MMRKTFEIVSVNLSKLKGVKKVPSSKITLIQGVGVEGDAHAAQGDRQVSLLALEDIQRYSVKGFDFKPGDFAENITTQGIDLPSLPIGTRLYVNQAVLEVSKIGKECHGNRCEIFQKTGDCIMPKRGIFAKVITEGVIHDKDRGHYDIG